MIKSEKRHDNRLKDKHSMFLGAEPGKCRLLESARKCLETTEKHIPAN